MYPKIIDDFHGKFIENFTNTFDEAFDQMFDFMLKQPKSFPPFNIVKIGKGKFSLEFALAGYDKKNVEVEYRRGVLTIQGEVDEKDKDYIHQGLTAKKFFKQFALHSDLIIDEAKMNNGVLTIKLGAKEPEKYDGIKVDIK